MILSSDGDSYRITGPRLTLYPARPTLADGIIVAGWRNTDAARAAFWNHGVVTPDSHVHYIQNKSPYDLIWIARQETGSAVGMAGLVVDPQAHTAEGGRYFVDGIYRGEGYGLEIDRIVLAFAFECLQLDSMWIDAWAANDGVIPMHLKAGWQKAGIDLPGHTQPGGPVLHMAITAQEWTALREGYWSDLAAQRGQVDRGLAEAYDWLSR